MSRASVTSALPDMMLSASSTTRVVCAAPGAHEVRDVSGFAADILRAPAIEDAALRAVLRDQ